MHDQAGPAPMLRDGLAAGGAPRMWEKVVRDALPAVRGLLPPGSSVLEVGYGDGLLSCFMCHELGWKIVGLDVRPEAKQDAEANAKRFGLGDAAVFHLLDPIKTREHAGLYDGVFVKTVLYSSRDLGEYSAWLDWIGSVLKPSGILVNFESGRANRLMQVYRRLRRREYTNLSLYTGEVERLYDERFETIDRRYYAGWSQFFSPLPGLYQLAAGIEESLSPRTAGNCFVVSFIGRKPVSSSAPPTPQVPPGGGS
jgi:protein-L-isoaspartate O-methyltransferase